MRKDKEDSVQEGLKGEKENKGKGRENIKRRKMGIKGIDKKQKKERKDMKKKGSRK